MRAQALVAAALLTPALLAPMAGQAEAADGQLEPEIFIDANAPAPAQSKTTLVAGRSYTLQIGGYYSEKIPTADGGSFTYFYDAVYCFEGSTPTSVCTASTPRVFDGGGLRARIGASGTFAPFYRSLGSDANAPAFKPGHNYSHTFTPGTSGKLQLSIPRDLRDSYDGRIGVTLYGPPSPGSTGPEQLPSPDLNDLLNGECQGAGGSPIFRMPRLRVDAATSAPPRFCPKRLKRVSGWNKPTAIAELVAGAEATVLGPKLSSNQREATVSLSTSSGDVAMTLSHDDAKFRRYARRACLTFASAQVMGDLFAAGLADPFDSTLDPDAFTQLAGVASYLLPCLKMVDDTLARKSARAGSTSARAAAARCGAAVFPIKAGATKNRDAVRLTSRRSYPMPGVLRVTCRSTAKGVVVRVRPRRSGVALRRIVGSRLSVGLVRAAGAKGTARGTIAFGR